jgi:arginine transport system permease protein
MNLIAYLPPLGHGLIITLLLMLSALILGALLACLMTLALFSHHYYLRKPIAFFIFFIRGTPLFVQIFLIYFGLGQFDWIRSSVLWHILQSPFACAVIALAMNTSAYTAILLKGAIHSVPEGEVTACQALGMSQRLMMKYIILPRAIRIALPAYSNEVMMILKATSLASTITLLDVMGVTNQIIANTYQTIPFLCLAGIIYLTINAIIMFVFRRIEKKANRYLCA